MHSTFRYVSLAAMLLLAPALLAQGKKPPAHYWMSVETRNFSIPGMSPEAGALGAMFGGMPGAGPQRSLTLQLSASGVPTSPEATHDIPPGQNMGKTLPLVTPAGAPGAGRQPSERPEGFERPQGRMLIYWGCGETVRSGQPAIIDFAAAASGQAPKIASRGVRGAPPPAPARDRTYGDWPNQKHSINVPRDSSLVGEHFVHGNYPPDIRFSVSSRHDFMAPVAFTNVSGGLTDAIRFQWDTIPTATGYFAMATSGSEQSKDVVFWTSSEVQEMGGGLLDYLPPAEVQRLIGERVVMSPQTDRCVIPRGIFKEAQGAALQFVAYGGELNLAHPPKPADSRQPWDPIWFVKLRLKSTAMLPLGMEADAPRGRAAGRERREAPDVRGEPTEKPGTGEGSSGSPLDAVKQLRGIFGF